MIMTLIIRKHSFTEAINSNYFGSFQNLLELDLGEETVSSLFTFFEASQTAKEVSIASFHSDESTRLRLHKSETLNLHGFVSFGIVDTSIFFDRIETMLEWTQLQDSITALYSNLGWSLSEFRKIDAELGEFDELSGEYLLYPSSFDAIDALWEQATPL